MIILETQQSLEIKAPGHMGQTYLTHFLKTLNLQNRYANSKILWKNGQGVNVNAVYDVNVTASHHIHVREKIII